MMETEDMTTNYPYGDNKSGDAANFGIFKQVSNSTVDSTLFTFDNSYWIHGSTIFYVRRTGT